ncbi:cystine transporter subunit [Escherichia coli]|uniref:Cystine transporter subunit n=1 Tax=Escherichia coli TaxID=562 RepID=A0A377BQ31_ECOLX|nr:cystine transporter subunit [Escherichia coli]
MKLAHLGRQALMGVMAVALVAGMSVKSFADEGLLNKVKERGTLLVGWKALIRRSVFREMTAN